MKTCLPKWTTAAQANRANTAMIACAELDRPARRNASRSAAPPKPPMSPPSCAHHRCAPNIPGRSVHIADQIGGGRDPPDGACRAV